MLGKEERRTFFSGKYFLLFFSPGLSFVKVLHVNLICMHLFKHMCVDYSRAYELHLTTELALLPIKVVLRKCLAHSSFKYGGFQNLLSELLCRK